MSRLHAERERYEETMKKAFMRGVCALNMEAMSMFQEAEQPGRDKLKYFIYLHFNDTGDDSVVSV